MLNQKKFRDSRMRFLQEGFYTMNGFPDTPIFLDYNPEETCEVWENTDPAFFTGSAYWHTKRLKERGNSGYFFVFQEKKETRQLTPIKDPRAYANKLASKGNTSKGDIIEGRSEEVWENAESLLETAAWMKDLHSRHISWLFLEMAENRTCNELAA